MVNGDHTTTDIRTGVFAGPTAGLTYQTPTRRGVTDERGRFEFADGEVVSFLLGELVLGSVPGAPTVNLAQLVHRVDGRIDRLHDPAVTNLARLVQTLDRDGDVESGVTIVPAVHDLVPSLLSFEQPEAAFERAVEDLLQALNAAPDVYTARTPRTLHTPEAARNELRRNIRGIVKTTDVRIPLRDGSFVYADVFRPAADGHYPVVMNKGFYGKAFNHDCIGSPEQAQEKEALEDRFFSGNPDGLQYENHESVDSAVWVPQGYVCIRVDSRGVGRSPGLQAPFSVQQSEDYFDAIEWAGTQPWSNGNVGLWGMSYLAMTQHMVASLQPPHLKAMIALGTDADLYNEATYGGGLFGEGFWMWWWKAMSGHNFVGEQRPETDWMARLRATEFNDPQAYGTNGSIFMSADLDRATAPVWIIGPQTGVTIHQLGSSETFIHSTAASARRFDFVDAWFPHSYAESTVAEHVRYFDHWLKGEDNGVLDGPSVRVQVRTGNGAHHVLHEQEWPIARTEYRRWYLDATPSDWTGDSRRDDILRIVDEAPDAPSQADYEAHLDLGRPTLAPTGPVGGTPRWSTGVSFVSDPLAEDLTLAGYMKAGLWVSSTSTDMDVFVSLRVIDEHDREVRYESVVLPIDPAHIHPVGHGLLKVSHRGIDEKRSTDYWPVHTHAEADHQPLRSGEVVPIEVGLYPSTALIRAGSRLRIDIQPYTPAGIPVRAYDQSYHDGARNTVYTGPDHPSYVQLPIVPPT
ncbi:CocE/NonD family hydrolase [Amycolatopsis sp. H20-H5]|uniref:CocE/NonD family hydrolase n=1 Tax=Amycolatopsis sp. H20-H5 TaxID=3046309 RepID=UPI002DBC2BB4|nr:CocE/NonD family hydrolase [Amycolatopsis sp. H20-H5]MEC3978012.1 CocE/NonD family hydrolase [Amycolatopsis sp. H20-H5]